MEDQIGYVLFVLMMMGGILLSYIVLRVFAHVTGFWLFDDEEEDR